MRLNKFLAQAGVCSRRQADVMIRSGKVTVNGLKVSMVGFVIDENRDVVRISGKKVSLKRERVYFLLNKPKGYLSTVKDNFNRSTVIDLLKDKDKKAFPVGRLDLNTEGVLLLTNDGDLSFRLTHPRFGIEKVYQAQVKGKFTKAAIEKIKGGIELEEEVKATAEAKILQATKEFSVIELKLKEGRKREVREILKKIGFPVIELKRIRFATLTAKGLKIGDYRKLTPSEVLSLKKMVGLI